jgi:uncharacterized phiE125 gp8 family phage protein
MRIELTTSPVNPAATLAGIKLFSFKNTDAFDAKISSLIAPATQYVERYTGRRLINQTVTIWMDRNEYADRLRAYLNTITLSTLNVSAINSLTLYAPDNSTSVVTASDYRLSGGILSASNRLSFNDQASISTSNLRNTDSVAIEVITGYGAADTDMPPLITQAMSIIIDHWVSFGTKSSKENLHDVPSSFKAIIAPFASTEAYF